MCVRPCAIRRANGGSLAMAVVQAAPLWIPALWMAVRPVREPLE